MGSTEDESNSEDGSYDSELSVSDSGSESDADTYPTPAPSQRASIVPPLGSASHSEATASSAQQHGLPPSGDRRSSGAQPSGRVSPSDVSLSALSLAGKLPTANGSGSAAAGDAATRRSTGPGESLRLDLAAAGDVSMRSPAGNSSHRESARNSSRSSARHRTGSHRAPALSIELVSPAFALDKDTLRLGEQSGAGPASVARQRAAAGLGVPAAALRLFELREVPQDGNLSPGVNRVAFAVADSRFSLAAVEETMAQNKRLMATNSHTTSALETLQQLVKEQNQALAKLKVQAGEATANARRLQDRCDTADRFAALLRQQLERSEGLRVQGQAALAELKHEFEALTTELLADGQLGDAAPEAPSPRLLAQAAAAQQRALQAGHAAADTSPVAALLAGPEGSRLTSLLERFSDDKILSRLEQCLDKAARS